MSRPLIAAAAIALTASPALAADGWSGDITLASQYVSKGTGKSGGDPHGALRLERGFGAAYAGAWWGNVDTAQGADSELHAYAGAQREVAGVGLDARAYYKVLPGTRDGVQDDLLEFRLDATKALGAGKLRLRVEFSPDSYAGAEEAWWIEGQVSRKLTAGLTASAGLGAREQNNGADYTAWNAGVRQSLGKGLDLDVRWYDTDSHGLGANNEGRLVAAVSLGF